MTTSRGFTLIEVVIVVVIVALLAFLLLDRRGGHHEVVCRNGDEVVYRQRGATLSDNGIIYYRTGLYAIPAGVFCENVYVEATKP